MSDHYLATFWSAPLKTAIGAILLLAGWLRIAQSNRIKAIEGRVDNRVKKDMCELQHKTVTESLERIEGGITTLTNRFNHRIEKDRRGKDGDKQ